MSRRITSPPSAATESQGSDGLARWMRGAMGLALAALILGVGFVFLRSEAELARQYVPSEEIQRFVLSADTPEQRERGRHLATVVAQCQFCHGPDLGGREQADDFWIGRLDSSNLTSGAGGLGGHFSEQDWVRAIRYGIRSDGRSLLLMPSRHLATLSDADLGAVIHFLRSVPPVDRRARPPRFGPVARLGIALGQVDDIFSARTLGAVEIGGSRGQLEAPTAEYGAYLVELGNCRVCHKSDLSGGLHPLALPSEPEPPPLVGEGALVGWTYADFDAAMREGRSRSGRVLDREFMPWPNFAALSPLEVEAMWRFLRFETARLNPRALEASRLAGVTKGEGLSRGRTGI